MEDLTDSERIQEIKRNHKAWCEAGSIVEDKNGESLLGKDLTETHARMKEIKKRHSDGREESEISQEKEEEKVKDEEKMEEKFVEEALEALQKMIDESDETAKKMLRSLVAATQKTNVYMLDAEEKLHLNIIHHILEGRTDKETGYIMYGLIIKILNRLNI